MEIAAGGAPIGGEDLVVSAGIGLDLPGLVEEAGIVAGDVNAARGERVFEVGVEVAFGLVIAPVPEHGVRAGLFDHGVQDIL